MTRVVTACEHTDRKHLARGLCEPCYRQLPHVKTSIKNWYERNKELTKSRARLWEQAHPDDKKASKRKIRYGMSKEDYQNMLIRQEHKCAICGTPASIFPKLLYVDHDHTTGLVRGLLCQLCNHMLGAAKDDPQRLRNAIAYLEGGDATDGK